MMRLGVCCECHKERMMKGVSCGACRMRWVREKKKLLLAYLHDGGERNCGCDLCRLVSEPVTSYQVGILHYGLGGGW